MSGAKHTPEPWTRDVKSAWGPDDKQVFTTRSITGCGMRWEEAENEANAARIVACVNALAGINPEAVPLMVEALEKFVALFLDSDMSPEDECHELFQEAKAALAKAKEQ